MATYIHELPDWPEFHWDHNALTRTAGRRPAPARTAARPHGGAWLFAAQRGRSPDPDRRRAQIQRDRGRNPRQGSGPLVDRAPPRHGDGCAGARRPQCRRRRRDDARRHSEIQQSRSRPSGCSAGMRRCFRPAAAACTKITVGAWRDDKTGPMQVVSGPDRRARRSTTKRRRRNASTSEMKSFLDWFNSRRQRSIPFSRRPSRICGLSPSTRSMTATAASRAPLPTCPSRVRRTARNASTACPRKSAWSGKPTTTFWKRRRKATSISRRGWSGFWDASTARSTARRRFSPLSFAKPILEKACSSAAQRPPARYSQPPAGRV